MAVSDMFERIWWLNHLLPCVQSIFLLLWVHSLAVDRGSAAHFFAGSFHRQHILGTLWVLNFDVFSAWRLMGVILTFLPCKVPSNLRLHKDLSHFPGNSSAIYFSGMSYLVIYRLC